MIDFFQNYYEVRFLSTSMKVSEKNSVDIRTRLTEHYYICLTKLKILNLINKVPSVHDR